MPNVIVYGDSFGDNDSPRMRQLRAGELAAVPLWWDAFCGAWAMMGVCEAMKLMLLGIGEGDRDEREETADMLAKLLLAQIFEAAKVSR
jgi:hypothetical protein